MISETIQEAIAKGAMPFMVNFFKAVSNPTQQPAGMSLIHLPVPI